MLLAGERLLFKDIHMLEIKDDAKIIKYLEESDFVKIIDGKEIVIKNYNLFRENFITVCDKEKLQTVSQMLLEKIYINEPVINMLKRSF